MISLVYLTSSFDLFMSIASLYCPFDLFSFQLYLGKSKESQTSEESEETVVPGGTSVPSQDNTNTDSPLSERPITNDDVDYLLSSEESDGDSEEGSDDEGDHAAFKDTKATPGEEYDTLD